MDAGCAATSLLHKLVSHVHTDDCASPVLEFEHPVKKYVTKQLLVTDTVDDPPPETVQHADLTLTKLNYQNCRQKHVLSLNIFNYSLTNKKAIENYYYLYFGFISSYFVGLFYFNHLY